MESRVCCCVLLALLNAAPALRAEDAPRTMAAALAQAGPDKNSVVLAVDAAKVALPSGAVSSGAPMTGQEVGALYGQTTQTFGTVTAIAPPTITVVYSPPETPNPYDGMPPGQVMRLLTQTFTPAQWKAFMSPAGVAYTEMVGETQPPLFQALFPGNHLSLIDTSGDSMDNPKFKREFPGSALTAARLRLGCLTSLALQKTDDPGSYVFAADILPAGTPPLYLMTNAQSSDVDHEYGAQVREAVPNTPKAGEMAFDAPALQAAVPLANIKTVGELVTRISLTTHREIYADPRYGSRLVTLAPSPTPQSAPAADLLQALAFCVGGTYRQVGPAFVLTDDIVGLGTKHALWKVFEARAAKMLPGGDGMFPTMTPPPNVPYTVQDIPDTGDPLAMTAVQKAMYWKKWALEPGQSSRFSMDVTVPFDQLTPAQQEAAQLDQQANENSHEHTTLTGTVMVQSEAEVEILLPGLTGRAVITQSYDGLLPYPALTPAQEQAERKRMESEFPGIADTDTPAPDFARTLRGFARRAARITLPKTAKEVSDTFDALRALGFSEAWIQVLPGPAAGDDALRARMAQAAAEGKRRGIAVLPALSLLHWAGGVPPEMQDRDLQGQTVLPPELCPFTPAVSPFAPAAALRLSALVSLLGSVPGIGGLVWDDTLTSGYEAAGESVYGPGGSLGYADTGRLAFLRHAHADPIDIQDNSYSDERAKIHVPGFDGDFHGERRLFTDWCRMRAGAEGALLRRLADALPPPFTSAGTRLPLLLPPVNALYTSIYGSWDSLNRPPPTVHFSDQVGPDGQPMLGVESIERMDSLLTYSKIRLYVPPASSADAWKAAAARALVQAAKRDDRNILLDLIGRSALVSE